MPILRPQARRLIQPAIYGAAGGGGGGTFTPTSTQSSNYLTRVGTVTGGNNTNHFGLSATECTAIDTMITGIITDLGGNTSLSTWPILDCLYFYLTTSAAVAKLNLVSSSFTLTQTGTVNFATDVGFTGDGTTGFLDTGFNPGTAAGNFGVNSAVLGSYIINARTTDNTGVSIGVHTGSSYAYHQPRNSSAFYWEMNAGTTFPNYAATSTKGAWVTTRTGSAAGALYQNNSSTALGTTYTEASVAIVSSNVYIFALNQAGAVDFCSDHLGASFIGGAVTAAQAVAINTRINTAVNSISGGTLNVFP